MIKHKASVKHSPPDTYGDCLRASVASILDVEDVAFVPHFFGDGCDAETAIARLNKFLASYGLKTFFIHFHHDNPLQLVLDTMGETNPGVHYLLFGQTAGLDHVVIALNNKIVHDTSWYVTPIEGASSDGWYTVMVFVSLRLAV